MLQNASTRISLLNFFEVMNLPLRLCPAYGTSDDDKPTLWDTWGQESAKPDSLSPESSNDVVQIGWNRNFEFRPWITNRSSGNDTKRQLARPNTQIVVPSFIQRCSAPNFCRRLPEWY